MAKLSNVVKNDVVKKTGYNKLVTKVNGINTTKFASITKYEKDGSDLEEKISDVDKKIPDIGGLVKKTDFNTKVTKIEGKIPSITGLAINSVLTAVENKIPDVSGLAKNTDYNTKLSEIKYKVSHHNQDKYIITPEFNRLTTENFKTRLAQANLIAKQILTLNLK